MKREGLTWIERARNRVEALWENYLRCRRTTQSPVYVFLPAKRMKLGGNDCCCCCCCCCHRRRRGCALCHRQDWIFLCQGFFLCYTSHRMTTLHSCFTSVLGGRTGIVLPRKRSGSGFFFDDVVNGRHRGKFGTTLHLCFQPKKHTAGQFQARGDYPGDVNNVGVNSGV